MKLSLEQVDPRTLGLRLQEARKAAGMTQQQVADRLGMARTTIVAIEKGERRVVPHELLQLASLYGRSVSSLVSKRAVTESLLTQFRANQRESGPGFDEATNELQSRSEDYVELERMVGAPSANRFPPEYDTKGGPPERIAEDVATAERNRLGIGDGPIGNLRDRLETDVGIRVFYFPMESRIAGVFGFNDILGACVGVNSNHPRDRRNWTLAHEYGHFLMDRYQVEVTVLTTDRKFIGKERLADSFAKYFLMPASGLNRRFTELLRANEKGVTLADVCTLSNLYQVSVQALVLRLEELSRLPTGIWERLRAEGFKVQHAQKLLGIDANPPILERLPRRYVALAVEAFRRGQLSEGQLSRYLRTDRVSVRSLMESLSKEIHVENGGEFRAITPDLAQTLGGR
ncbi:MAG: XRE family transcriptional regulator [Candidatus Acidiferrales bacterium]|jgi:Zn-dependent peptidase ImmA (M78 family)/DNA-binding XRE family transcriptional regulator